MRGGGGGWVRSILTGPAISCVWGVAGIALRRFEWGRCCAAGSSHVGLRALPAHALFAHVPSHARVPESRVSRPTRTHHCRRLHCAVCLLHPVRRNRRTGHSKSLPLPSGYAAAIAAAIAAALTAAACSPHCRSPHCRSPHHRRPHRRSAHRRSIHRRSPHHRSRHRHIPHLRRSPNRRSPHRRSPHHRSPNRRSPHRRCLQPSLPQPSPP